MKYSACFGKITVDDQHLDMFCFHWGFAMDTRAVLGFFSPWIVYAVITLLHVALPAMRRKGYVRHEHTGKLMEYKLNGHLVLPGTILLWLVLGYIQLVPWTWLYEIRWYGLAGAVTLGILFTLIIVLPWPAKRKNILADLWFGRLKDPQCKKGNLLIDTKMWLYLVGAVMLQLNVLSCLTYHWQMAYYLQDFDFNPGLLMGVAMITFFVWDYLSFEGVHLYTYDFIAERVGFKLGFGCLAFYPFFYTIAIWSTAHLPNPGHPMWLNVLFILVFVSGWVLARGANLQKYYFKISPAKKFLGIKPKVLTDEKYSLLVNGWWGKSRHINYLGEILMACGIALAAGYPGVLWVWLYPLYYVCLLFTRQVDDDKICGAKYGELWEKYKKKVKYRIIPYIY